MQLHTHINLTQPSTTNDIITMLLLSCLNLFTSMSILTQKQEDDVVDVLLRGGRRGHDTQHGEQRFVLS